MAYFRETSTMISDLVLSLSAFFFGSYRMNVVRTTSWRYVSIGWFGMIGFTIIAFAAFLGFVRYGYFFPRRQHSIHGWHHYFSDMSSFLALPLIAAAYTQRTAYDNYCWLFMALGIIGVLLHCIEALHLAVRDFLAAMAVIFIIASCAFFQYSGVVNVKGLVGGLAFVFAGIVSSEGRWVRGVKNVDVFHYSLAVGVYLLSEGLLA